MRPMLKPALVPMWRSSTTLQLGLAGGHTRVIEGFDDTGRMVLGLLDGTRDLEQIHAAARPVAPTAPPSTPCSRPEQLLAARRRSARRRRPAPAST